MTQWNELFSTSGPSAVFDDARLGPIQKADACLLAAIVQYVKPEVGIEFGCLDGHSASVLARFCKKLYCVDIDQARPGMNEVLGQNSNIEFVQHSMRYWVPPDDVWDIGLLWIDASHLYEDSVAAFRNCESRLAKSAIVTIHDTEAWIDDRFKLDIREEVVKNERFFAEWLQSHGWNRIAFGCRTDFRHGLVIFQKESGW